MISMGNYFYILSNISYIVWKYGCCATSRYWPDEDGPSPEDIFNIYVLCVVLVSYSSLTGHIYTHTHRYLEHVGIMVIYMVTHRPAMRLSVAAAPKNAFDDSFFCVCLFSNM